NDEQNVSYDRQQEINKTWPGPFTWFYPASKQVSSFITGQFETVAVRVTAHPVAKALCEAFAGAIISTSANISDTPPLKEFDEVTSLFKNTITGVVEGKVGSQEKPTAIFDAITGKQYR
ncbi:MAG: Sua5/YciO/YrdC/YwlC family protein, partial [Candidatus Berkiella sp.]